MRIVLGAALALCVIVLAVVLWPVDRTPTLPDTGPGARRVTGAANLGEGVDAGGEGPSTR